MLRLAMIVSSLGLTSPFLGGCSTPAALAVPADAHIHFVVLGPAPETGAGLTRPFILGAGDPLGEAIFTQYVASLYLDDDAAIFATVPGEPSSFD